MKTLTLIFFLVVSFSFCMFAVQKQSINGIYQKEIQFKGSRGFWKPKSFLSQDGLFLQRLPHSQFYQMQKRKSKGDNKRKAIVAHPALATKQPLSKLDFPTGRIFDCLEKFYGRGGAGAPTETTNFLLAQFFSPEHMPASQWKKDFVSDTVYEVAQLNNFIVQLHELWEWKKLFDKHNNHG